MAIRSGRTWFAGAVAAGALVLGVPTPYVAGGAALVAAAGAGMWLVRGRRTRPLTEPGSVPRSDEERAQLASRWDAWVERRYPLAVRGDAGGKMLAIEDRRGGASELAAKHWLGGSFEASLEREHRAALRA